MRTREGGYLCTYLSIKASTTKHYLQNLVVESCTTGRNVGTPEGGNQGNPSNKWNLGAGRSKMFPYETFSSKNNIKENKNRLFQT